MKPPLWAQPLEHLGSVAFSTGDLVRLRFIWAQAGRRGASLIDVSRSLLVAETAAIPGFGQRASLLRCWELAQLGAAEAAEAAQIWQVVLEGTPLPE